MEQRQILATYDFDGTITNCDTFIDFIQHTFGFRKLMIGLLLNSAFIIAFKLKLYPNWKAKERVFSHFFKNVDIVAFDECCERYFHRRYKKIFNEEAVLSIKKHLESKHKVVIISASINNWILPFAKYLGIENVIATTAEVNNGILTGKFSSANCYGKEKVRRLQCEFPDRNNFEIYAYGDSQGDQPMLDYADNAFFRSFE